jgi:hypothetical protein
VRHAFVKNEESSCNQGGKYRIIKKLMFGNESASMEISDVVGKAISLEFGSEDAEHEERAGT